MADLLEEQLSTNTRERGRSEVDRGVLSKSVPPAPTESNTGGAASSGGAAPLDYQLTLKGAALIYANTPKGSDEEVEALDLLKEMLTEEAR